MPSEAEIRAQAAHAQLKVQALDWLDTMQPEFKRGHSDSCASEDLTGHPAPCTCGYNERTKLSRFIRDAIMKA